LQIGPIKRYWVLARTSRKLLRKSKYLLSPIVQKGKTVKGMAIVLLKRDPSIRVVEALITPEEKEGEHLVADKIFGQYKTLLLDLDGVIYEGTNAIKDSVETISMFKKAGTQVGYVTNNSSRTEEAIAEQLSGFGIELSAADIISSAQAGAELLATMVPKGSKVLVVGGEGLRKSVRDAGFEIVDSSEEKPAAVIQGFAPEVSWLDLAEASYAIQGGAKWVATNQDWTIPREKGIAPGNGTLVSAVHTAVGQLPIVAGKPERAIFDTALRVFETDSAIYVGDRLDTDVLGANGAGIGSALVMTGVTTRKELLAAKADSRPEYILGSMTELMDSYKSPVKTKRGFKLDDVEVELLGEKLVVSFGDPRSLAALKAACLTIWESGKPIHTLDVESALYE
jgi:HAD superfamily hydrolase (TIGR01457 family)